MTTVSIDNDYRIVVVNDSNGDTAVVTAPSQAVIIETTGLGPQGPGGVVALYGNFIDTTDQPLVSTSAAQPLTLNTTLENRGITVTNGSRINFELAGTYKILASLQITNNSNDISEVNVFFKQNGTTITNSNTRIDLDRRKAVSVPYHDCFTIELQLSVTDGDYVEIYWHADNTGITIDTIPQDALHPQAPSAIINIAQVMFASPGETYVYSQSTPSSTWTIAHNLGFRPSVEICDSGSQEVEADVTHLSTNVAVILFTVPVAGFARLT